MAHVSKEVALFWHIYAWEKGLASKKFPASIVSYLVIVQSKTLLFSLESCFRALYGFKTFTDLAITDPKCCSDLREVAHDSPL
jgi:hypothetical protein